MVHVAVLFSMLVGFAVASAAPRCQTEEHGVFSRCPTHQGLALVQTRRSDSRVGTVITDAESAAIKSGDGIFLRVARTSQRLAAQEDGVVHAKWANRGTWETFTIEREAGSGDVQSGDVVFLLAWNGKTLTVGDYQSEVLVPTVVHTKWGQKGKWQKFAIEKEGSEGLIIPILDADKIFLRAWTGSCVDADAPDSAGVVQARWDHMGSWQELVIEAREQATTVAPTTTPLAEEETVSGCMTMWSKNENVVTGSHCGYAASDYGGMQFLPATRSKYIRDVPHMYCAIHNRHFAGGEACGKCFKLKYDGHGTGSCSGTQENHAPNAGEGIIQVVDSGSGNHDFDCVESTFESITGYDTDRFPIEYEEVDCDTHSCERSTEDCILHVVPPMTQKGNGYLGSARVIFFNLHTSVKSVKAKIGICGEQDMARNGALWDVSFSMGGCSYKPIIFTATLSDGEVIEIDATEWTQFKDLSWCHDDGVWVNPSYTCTSIGL